VDSEYARANFPETDLAAFATYYPTNQFCTEGFHLGRLRKHRREVHAGPVRIRTVRMGREFRSRDVPLICPYTLNRLGDVRHRRPLGQGQGRYF